MVGDTGMVVLYVLRKDVHFVCVRQLLCNGRRITLSAAKPVAEMSVENRDPQPRRGAHR